MTRKPERICHNCGKPNGRKNGKHGYCTPCNRELQRTRYSPTRIQEMADSYRPKENK